MNPSESEKMMCRCAAVPVYVSSVSEVIFWNQFLIFFGDVVKFHVMISIYLIDRTVQFFPCVLGFTALYHWSKELLYA